MLWPTSLSYLISIIFKIFKCFRLHILDKSAIYRRLLNILPHLKRIATLRCKILMLVALQRLYFLFHHYRNQSLRLPQDVIFVLLPVISLLCRLTDWVHADIGLSLSLGQWQMELTAETSAWSYSHHICFWTITVLKTFFLFRVLMYL